MSAYRSIFWEPDWVHTRFLGWADRCLAPDLRVMTKRSGPLLRSLVLRGEQVSAEHLLGALRSLQGPLAEITVRDLEGSAEVAARLEAQGYRPVGSARMLNEDTVAIDVRADDATLLAAMPADTRREIRVAERAGVTVRLVPAAQTQDISAFRSAYEKMATERALRSLDEKILTPELLSSHSRLFVAEVDGEAVSFLQTYEAGTTAMYYRGVSPNAQSNGAGRYLQWMVMRQLRQEGFAWYDLGGLPSRDRKNGIVRFKLSFGGEIVSLGHEYRWSGRGAAGVRSLAGSIVALRAKSSIGSAAAPR